MTYKELAQAILNLPPQELNKEVVVFDYNEKVNPSADAFAAIRLEPWDLDKPQDYMIVFDSNGRYYDLA